MAQFFKLAFDAAAGGESKRRIDENGYLRVEGCPITSAGVFDYARSEVGLDGDPNELVKVSRPLSAITSSEFLGSCQSLPIVNDHTYLEGLTSDGAEEADGVDPSKKGVCGTLSNVRYNEDTGWVVGDIVVYSRALIRQIMSGKKTELSLGYTCVFTPTEEGDCAATQTGMSGNHLALVDRARVPGARILDSAFPNPSNQDEQMKKKAPAKAPAKAKAMDGAAVEKLRELLLPALQKFLSEESSEPEQQEEMTPEVKAEGEEVAPEPEVKPEGDEGEEVAPEPEGEGAEEGAESDGDIVALLQQLLAALQPAAEAGDEEAEEAIGDEEAEEKQLGDEGLEDNAEAKPGVTMDSMFKAVAERDALYARVSKVTGAFDHAAMSTGAVAAYGVKKLGIKCKAGDSAVALGAYLSGVEASAKTVKSTPAKVGDAAASAELDAYLNGSK